MNIFFSVIGSKHDDPCLRELVGDGPGRCYAVHYGHSQIHKCYMWRELSVQLNGEAPVHCLADNLHVRLRIDDRHESHANDELIVNNQNSNRAVVYHYRSLSLAVADQSPRARGQSSGAMI